MASTDTTTTTRPGALPCGCRVHFQGLRSADCRDNLAVSHAAGRLDAQAGRPSRAHLDANPAYQDAYLAGYTSVRPAIVFGWCGACGQLACDRPDQCADLLAGAPT